MIQPQSAQKPPKTQGKMPSRKEAQEAQGAEALLLRSVRFAASGVPVPLVHLCGKPIPCVLRVLCGKAIVREGMKT
jgi:hypothetical protein